MHETSLHHDIRVGNRVAVTNELDLFRVDVITSDLIIIVVARQIAGLIILSSCTLPNDRCLVSVHQSAAFGVADSSIAEVRAFVHVAFVTC